MKLKLLALKLGIVDGWQSPEDLSSGITWDDRPDLNELYDWGANVGQFLGRLCLRRNQ